MKDLKRNRKASQTSIKMRGILSSMEIIPEHLPRSVYMSLKNVKLQYEKHYHNVKLLFPPGWINSICKSFQTHSELNLLTDRASRVRLSHLLKC